MISDSSVVMAVWRARLNFRVRVFFILPAASVAEAERLHVGGYECAGQWDLGQVCFHLAMGIKKTMDGFNYEVSWPMRAIVGPFLVRRLFKTRWIKSGIAMPPGFVSPAAGLDEAKQVRELREAVDRFKRFEGEIPAHPFFGRLTKEQCRQFHAIHGAHHLGFLVPRAGR